MVVELGLDLDLGVRQQLVHALVFVRRAVTVMTAFLCQDTGDDQPWRLSPRGDLEVGGEMIDALKAPKNSAKDAVGQARAILREKIKKQMGGDKNFEMIRSFQRVPVPDEEVMDLLRQFGTRETPSFVDRLQTSPSI